MLVHVAHKTKIWTKAAHISATIVKGGKLVGTWNHKKVGRKLLVSIHPFDETLYGEDRNTEDSNPVTKVLKMRAQRLAAYLNVSEYELEVHLPRSSVSGEGKAKSSKKQKGKPPCFDGARCRRKDDAAHNKKYSHPQSKTSKGNKNKKTKKRIRKQNAKKEQK